MDTTLLNNIEKAKDFWRNVNVDNVFDMLLQCLMNLRDAIKTKTASDNEYAQSMLILQSCGISDTLNMKHFAIQEVVIGEDFLTNTEFGCLQLPSKEDQLLERLESDEQNGSSDDTHDSQVPVILNHKDPLTPPSPHQNLFDLMLLSTMPSPHLPDNNLDSLYPKDPPGDHHCGPLCVTAIPRHPDHFLGQNPLRAPLLCKFRRQCFGRTRYSSSNPDNTAATTTSSSSSSSSSPPSPDGDDGEAAEKEGEAGVVYKAPCGRLLGSFAEVWRYLHKTEAFGVLQPWNFSFCPAVQPERVPLAATVSKRDLSRGVESVPVQLCNEVDASQPTEFRYRRERWPHGCFLCAGAGAGAGELFSACCDCTDGCADSSSCACLQLSQKAAGGEAVEYYTHQRLRQPVQTGLYECSPWCGCDPVRCQNRLVQHGVRVRLQVFRKKEGGWGVRCRDDLDSGTFVCTYAGVVLRTEQSTEESPPRKAPREEPMSDDEVEVVEEWTHPVLPPAGSLSADKDTCAPSHIPVIQGPADHTGASTDAEQDTLIRIVKIGPEVEEHMMETDEKPEEENKAPQLRPTTIPTTTTSTTTTKTTNHLEGVQKSSSHTKQSYYLDATKEGNVGRFINQSSRPNLFVQNVFVDTHDPLFPMVAFFTSRTVKAGTELTWSNSEDHINGN